MTSENKMTDHNIAEKLFFTKTGLDPKQVQKQIEKYLHGADDGEIYFEYSQSEAIAFDDGHLKNASYDTTQGFGLRAVSGEITSYAHASILSPDAIDRAGQTVRSVLTGTGGTLDVSPTRRNDTLYMAENPLSSVDFTRKVKLLEQMDQFARQKDERIKQVSASISGSWDVIHIRRPDGSFFTDIRPLVRLNINVIAGLGNRQESGNHGVGGRYAYDDFMIEHHWQSYVEEAIRQATSKLDAVPAPAGEMPVVLGPGWPGVMLHEAVGHGLEGDFNRKKTSAFAGLRGQRVAAKGVTVVDDGTMAHLRGSLTIDDEGEPTQKTVLIEDGILKGFMQDRLNARLMGEKSTGNGRRESYAYMPMPRMTNTYMMAGDKDPAEIIKSVKKGLYAVNFGGGQVDITSGKYVFSASEAYLIENGKVTAPVKGATLIGNGPESLKHISMIGNDLKLDDGVGTCGKDGQSVPVGVGQPTILMDKMTVGGTIS